MSVLSPWKVVTYDIHVCVYVCVCPNMGEEPASTIMDLPYCIHPVAALSAKCSCCFLNASKQHATISSTKPYSNNAQLFTPTSEKAIYINVKVLAIKHCLYTYLL